MQLGGGIQNDPLIRGSDGSVFHFDYVGDFALVENGDGLKVGTVVSGYAVFTPPWDTTTIGDPLVVPWVTGWNPGGC